MDDDFDILAMLGRLLRRMDFEVHEAADGEEALRLVRSIRPRLVILDVMMPKMSGWEVCRAIREDPSIADTRVLMLTGIGERLNEMTSPLYGADDFIDKPFDVDDFKARVLALIGER